MTNLRNDHTIRLGRLASRIRTAARNSLAVLILGSISVETQPGRIGQVKHITIPALANATKPSDLDFMAVECDIDPSGHTMECQFQQVFLTVAAFDAQTCLVTTNRYSRTFQNQTATRWVSTEGPEGVCGVLDVTTLQNEGVRWTLEAHKVVTKRDASPACRDVDEKPEVLSWRDTRRALPCRFVQPGAISP
jgi:hypothetical protein